MPAFRETGGNKKPRQNTKTAVFAKLSSLPHDYYPPLQYSNAGKSDISTTCAVVPLRKQLWRRTEQSYPAKIIIKALWDPNLGTPGERDALQIIKIRRCSSSPILIKGYVRGKDEPDRRALPVHHLRSPQPSARCVAPQNRRFQKFPFR